MKKVQSLAFTALLCAIHIIIIFMNDFLPFSDLFIIFFLPIFSAILAIKCELRYSLILFVSTMLIGCLINPVSAVLSIMTPLVYGITYGLLIRYKVKSTTIIYLLTLSVIGLLLLDIYIISNILNENFIEILCNFLHQDSMYKSKEVIFLLLAYSFSQSVVTHFILKFSLKKMKIKVVSNPFPPFFLCLMVLASVLTAIFIKQPIYKHLCWILSAIFAFPYFVYGFQKNKALVPLLISCSVIFLVGTIPLLRVVKEGYQYLLFLLIMVPPLFYGVFRQFKENGVKKVLTTI